MSSSSTAYLKITFPSEFSVVNENNEQEKFEKKNVPFANSKIYFTSIDNVEKLTNGEDVKTTYKLGLNLKDIHNEFLPGDTIGILPRNNESVVDKLIERLNISSVANKPCVLKLCEQTTNKKFTIPKHLPLQSTLKNIFLYYVDVQTPPKKLFLKSLIRFLKDPEEREKIEYLCSVKGAKEYGELITGPGKTLLGLLDTFLSCQPPVEIVLQNLPPLQPRIYSISSSALASDTLEITFFPYIKDDGTKGVCTSWLEDLIKQNKINSFIPFYFRQPTHFRLPHDLSIPLVMIATGTGISPFRAFLQHRLLIQNNHNANGDVWLFYGCRYSDKDYLYREEMEDYVKKKILTRLDLSFSRDSTKKHYVQHNIEKYGEKFVEWILQKQAKVYVCGNVRTVVKDVTITIINNLMKYGGMDGIGAEIYFKKMQNEKQFVVDMWD